MCWIHQFFVMYVLIVQALQANFMSLQALQHWVRIHDNHNKAFDKQNFKFISLLGILQLGRYLVTLLEEASIVTFFENDLFSNKFCSILIMDAKMKSGQIWMNVDNWCVTIFIYNAWRYDSWMKTIYCSFLCTSVVIKELFWDGNILLVALEALALNMLVTIAVVHIGNLKTLGVFLTLLCMLAWGDICALKVEVWLKPLGTSPNVSQIS